MLFKIILFLTVATCSAGPPDIIRPCHFRNTQCIAENLALKAKCSRNVRGFIPGEYTLKWFRFEAPFFNATYFDNHLKIRNHNKCFVSEFFFSMSTLTFVLGLDCPNLEFESTRTVIQHQSLREDMLYNYNFSGIYPLVRLTITVPSYHMDLCRTHTYADVTALPIFKVDPNDRKTANYLSTDLSLLNIYERETFFYRANLLARYYINAIICDFGCDF